MLELGDCPFGHAVALCTVLAEQSQVPVFGGVASSAIEDFARGVRIKLTGNSNAQPRLQRLERGSAGVVRSRREHKCPCADLGELHVVHCDRADVRTLMLDVTCPALPDARVERGRLTTEKALVVRWTARAFGGGHATVRT